MLHIRGAGTHAARGQEEMKDSPDKPIVMLGSTCGCEETQVGLCSGYLEPKG